MTMKTNRSILAAIFFGAALAAGCTHLGDKTAGQSLDDATITTKVKAKFVEDKEVSAMNIKVDTYDGTVQLSGFAHNRDEARRAEDLAKSVNGVKVVKNDIRLAPK